MFFIGYPRQEPEIPCMAYGVVSWPRRDLIAGLLGWRRQCIRDHEVERRLEACGCRD
jgi:hypothetical protein